MTHRDVSLSLFGLVLGVILGAGSLAYVQHSSLDASVVALSSDLHRAPTANYNTRRGINARGIPLNPEPKNFAYPTVKPEQSSSSVAPVTEEVTTCTAVRKAVEKIRTVYKAVIPVNVGTTDLRAKMEAVLSRAVADECGEQPTTAAPAATQTTVESEVTPVDNHCENYPQSARRTQCFISNKLGKKFP